MSSELMSTDLVLVEIRKGLYEENLSYFMNLHTKISI